MVSRRTRACSFFSIPCWDEEDIDLTHRADGLNCDEFGIAGADTDDEHLRLIELLDDRREVSVMLETP